MIEADPLVSRVNNGLLGPAEARAIAWLAPRLPAFVTPDRLSGLALIGAAMVLVGYAAYPSAPQMLWLANLGLVLHWFGDSLDGSLARYRKIERPLYGFYLDNSLDVISQFVLAIGLALSGILRVELALVGLAAFYMMAQLTLIKAHISRVFPLNYGPFGTTELRVVFILFNIVVLIVPPKPFNIFGVALGYPDLLSAAWISMIFATFFVTMVRDLRSLARRDPPRC